MPPTIVARLKPLPDGGHRVLCGNPSCRSRRVFGIAGTSQRDPAWHVWPDAGQPCAYRPRPTGEHELVGPRPGLSQRLAPGDVVICPGCQFRNVIPDAPPSEPT